VGALEGGGGAPSGVSTPNSKHQKINMPPEQLGEQIYVSVTGFCFNEQRDAAFLYTNLQYLYSTSYNVTTRLATPVLLSLQVASEMKGKMSKEGGPKPNLIYQ